MAASDDRHLLGPADRRLLERWSGATAALPLACVHRLFADQVVRSPEAVALLFPGGQLSYRELDVAANRMAHLLRRHGVGPERVVGVAMARGSGLIIALLAILKAGGAYLPLDPNYPAAHLAYMLEDAAPTVLLSDGSLPAELVERAATSGLPMIAIGEIEALLAGEPDTPPEDLAGLDTLAYIIYTSGSTGRPKGVMLEHRSVANFLLGSGRLYELGAADRGLHFSSVSFDASVDEIFTPLLHGAALVVTEGHTPPDFAGLEALIAQHAITMVSLPTAYWHAWISELDDGRVHVPPPLRLVIIGGEAASGERYNRWRALVPPVVRLLNTYGPTETTVASTWYGPSPSADEPLGPLAIGRPLPNEQLYVLDGERRPVALGETGELYIGGIGLARGYHNRPDLTSERFVLVDGLGNQGPVRLYRTGDLVSWRRDGQLEYHGRADQQLKIRGYRIEPGEIEAVLRSHSAVQAAAVMAHPDAAGELALVGYVVLKRGLAPDELRTFVEERLPHYLVPAAFVPLNALPLTPGGKLDRRALPPPVLATQPPTAVAADEQARTGVEQALVAIWEQLLGRRGIGVNESFFDLGGHSLLAMRMLTRVATELGARLPVSVMIHHPTVAGLARAIAEADSGNAWSVLVPIQTRGKRTPLFCVHGITGDVLWFNELGRCLAPDQPLYGLQARGLAPGQPYATTIEAMAADYVAAIRGVQPRGPYLIAGASFGGLIALEMAQQLVAASEQVALLGIFDYDPYQEPQERVGVLRSRLRALKNFPHWLHGELANKSEEECVAWLKWRLRFRLRQLVGALLGGRPLPPSAEAILPYGGDLPLNRRELLLANDVAYDRYQPRPYQGRITLYATNALYPTNSVGTTTGWDPLAAGGVELVPVPGAHDSMFKQPYVAQLAHLLRRQIDQALREVGHG